MSKFNFQPVVRNDDPVRARGGDEVFVSGVSVVRKMIDYLDGVSVDNLFLFHACEYLDSRFEA